MARDVFVALAIVIAKAALLSWKWQIHFGFTATHMIKCGKVPVSELIGEIVYTTKKQSDWENSVYLWKNPG